MFNDISTFVGFKLKTGIKFAFLFKKRTTFIATSICNSLKISTLLVYKYTILFLGVLQFLSK